MSGRHQSYADQVCWHFATDLLLTSRYQDACAWPATACRLSTDLLQLIVKSSYPKTCCKLFQFKHSHKISILSSLLKGFLSYMNFVTQTGTDRSNIVQMSSTDLSYPMGNIGTLVGNAQIVHKMDSSLETSNAEDLAVMMASACKYTTKKKLFSADVPTEYERNFESFALLDEFSPSCSLPLIQLKKGTYFFMCTRNNNFSNRSQKGRITVT